MNKKYLLIVLILLSFLTIQYAEESDIEIGGFLKLDYRFMIDTAKKDIPFYDVFSNFHLKMHKDISENIAIEASGDFRIYGGTGILNTSDMSDPGKQYLIDPMLWEVYVDIYDLGFEGMDLRLGKQRLAWGKADKLNPTANLNPDDFSDIFNFGEQIPSFAAKLEYEANDKFAFELIWLPLMKHALMPRDDSIQLDTEVNQVMAPFQGQLALLPPGMTMTAPNVIITPTAYDLKHSMQAIKIKGTLSKIDYSISYLHGFDDIPVLNKIDILPNASMTSIDTEINMGFYEYHVAGMDLAGELSGIGWWAEGAMFFPVNEINAVVSLPDLSTGQMFSQEIEVFGKTPYFKSTLGLDYTFAWSMYVNFQYVHGMPMERGRKENINDYIIGRVEQKFLHDKFKIILNGALGIIDAKDFKNNYGYLINPELKWLPYSSIEFTLGAYIISGEGQNFLTALKSHDMIYMQARVDF